MSKAQAFREQIKPLMDQVVELATQNGIAFSSIFQIEEIDDAFHFSAIQNLKDMFDKVNVSPELLLVAVANKAPSELVQVAVGLLTASIRTNEVPDVG